MHTLSNLSTRTTALQTRCPHCKTLFQIQESQLRAASGQARCSNCDNIFNARKHLTQTDPDDRPPQDNQQSRKSSGTISLSGLFEETEWEEDAAQDFNTGMLSADANRYKNNQPTDENQTKSELEKPLSHPEESNPDDQSISLQDKLSFAAMLDKRAFDPVVPELESPQTRQQTDDSEPLTDLHFYPESTLHTNKTNQEGRPILWSIAILCLLVTALAQSVWIVRDDLRHYPEVRELLELVCTHANCELPPWREPERFSISSRSVRTHPMSNSALQIQLVFSNTALFAQPYPQLQLKLYDINEKLSAQRVFTPEEYLAEPQNKAPLVSPAQSVEVEMALTDPGADVSGFKIEFL